MSFRPAATAAARHTRNRAQTSPLRLGQGSGVQQAEQYPNRSCFAACTAPQPEHFVFCSPAGTDDVTWPRSHAYSLRRLAGFLPPRRGVLTGARLSRAVASVRENGPSDRVRWHGHDLGVEYDCKRRPDYAYRTAWCACPDAQGATLPVNYVTVCLWDKGQAGRADVRLHWTGDAFAPCLDAPDPFVFLARGDDRSATAEEQEACTAAAVEWANSRGEEVWRDWWRRDIDAVADILEGRAGAEAQVDRAVAYLPAHLVRTGVRVTADAWYGTAEDLRMVLEDLAYPDRPQ